MWAVRKRIFPLRSHGCCYGTLSAYSGKLKVTSTLEHVSSNPEHSLIRPDIYFSFRPMRFAHSSSPHSKFFNGTRSLSSEAGTEHSEKETTYNQEHSEEDDGFSELEAVDSNTNSAGEENATEEAGGELVFEPELSDDESAPHNHLAENEAEVGGDKETTYNQISPLFKILMDVPRHAINATLDKWVADGNHLGRTEYASIILSLRKRRMFGKALQVSEWVGKNKEVGFTERDYASHIDLIAKIHGFYQAEKYIEKIPSAFRGEVIYRTLLANCSSLNNLKKSEEIFNKMRKMGFTLSSFAINQLLLVYIRLDKKKIADVLTLMEKENVKPDHFTYKLLIDTKGRFRDIDGMEQVIEKMKSDGIEPNLMIQATIARHYIFAGHNEKAKVVLKEIEGDGILQNRAACRILLPLYASLGKADEVERIWKVYESSPRLDECIAAIEAWGKLGRIEDAEAVFEMMLKSWKSLSSRCYTILMKVYANHKMLNKGKELASRMAGNGCPIGPLTWDALVKLYVEAGEVKKAESILFKASQGSTLKPMYTSYITLLDKYASKGDIHSAEKIFNRSRQDGYAGRLLIYQSLLRAYINSKTPAYGFRERLKADNVFPNKSMADQLALVDAFKRTAISDLLD